MPSARNIILSRVRNAIADRDSSRPLEEYSSLVRDYCRAGKLEQEGRLRLFTDRLRDYDVNVIETPAHLISEKIVELLKSQEQNNIVVADGLEPPKSGAVRWIPELCAGIHELDTCDGVLTLCTIAIAATGTIVLRHEKGEGARRLTLLPDHHFCIVREDQVVETVPEAIGYLRTVATQPLTFISGPSATADIEMTRIRGVHGPRSLDVILVRNGSAMDTNNAPNDGGTPLSPSR